MKSLVFHLTETGRVVVREVRLDLTASDLKNVVKESFPALSWADLSEIRLSVKDYDHKERVICDEEGLCDIVEEMEETRVKVKVHRMLPLCCGGCERPYDVGENGECGGSEKARVALKPCHLQCGHSVCASCIRGMMKKHEAEEDVAENVHVVKRIKIVCPTAECCRESSWLSAEEEKEEENEGEENENENRKEDSTAFFAPTPHVAMEEYIKWQRRHVDEESMQWCQAEAAMECSECGSRGSVMCETCNRVYCDNCHPMIWQHHRLTPLTELHCEGIRKDKEDDVKRRRCEAHPEEECTLYCRSEGCECLVCSRCVFSTKEHFQHDVIPLDEAVACVCKRLEIAHESWLKLIDSTLTNMNRSQLNWEEVSADLEKLFDALERRLRELRQTTMEDMRRRYVNAEKSLVEESVRIGEQLGQLRVSVDRVKQLLKSDTSVNSDLDLTYSARDRVETITLCDTVLRTLPEIQLDENTHCPIFPSVTKSVLSGLLTLCRPYRLEALRVCGESITVRFHTAFASVGPMNENVVELEYHEVLDDNLDDDARGIDVGTIPKVSGVVHDHMFTIRGLTPNKKYQIRIVDNPEVELICRTAHLTGCEIGYRFHAFGKDVERDNGVIEAINHYEELVKEGNNGAALASLGICYHYGIYKTKDVNRAVELYQGAIELNNDDGQFVLGRCYEEGDGVEKSVSEAIRLYTLAAKQGHPDAQNQLGCFYLRGEGVEAIYSEAVKWFRLAAHQGHSHGQYNLGIRYLVGKGVDKDLVEGVKWLQLAVDQGHNSALYELGRCYEKGRGVIKNCNRAVSCYKDAAWGGSKRAKLALKRLNMSLV